MGLIQIFLQHERRLDADLSDLIGPQFLARFWVEDLHSTNVGKSILFRAFSSFDRRNYLQSVVGEQFTDGSHNVTGDGAFFIQLLNFRWTRHVAGNNENLRTSIALTMSSNSFFSC